MKSKPVSGASVKHEEQNGTDAVCGGRVNTGRFAAIAASLSRTRSGFVALVILFSAAACSLPQAQPDLTRYFLLNEVTHRGAVGEVVGEPPRIVLRPVIVPEYLRGRIMQVRVADNELRFIDVARWAEPLESGLTRVLREDLAQRPSEVRVVARGVDEHDFDVAVNLRRCEGVLPQGLARLAARIEIFSTGTDPQLVAQEDFTFDVPNWDGSDYGLLAKKLSEAADALAARIVTLLPDPQPKSVT